MWFYFFRLTSNGLGCSVSKGVEPNKSCEFILWFCTAAVRRGVAAFGGGATVYIIYNILNIVQHKTIVLNLHKGGGFN